MIRTFKSVFKLTLVSSTLHWDYPAGNYMFKVNNRKTKTRFEICSKLTIKTSERSGVTVVNLEHISHLFPMFLLLTLSR